MENNIKDILINEEALMPIINGIMKATEVVASTMGPEGDNVIIPNIDQSFMNSRYRITKDGVSVIKSIRLKDHIENIGADLIKDAADKTLRDAGDGTTTATVLTGALIQNMVNFNRNEVKEYLKNEKASVLEKLKEASKEVTDEDVINIAKISANGDDEISENISEAFKHSQNVKIEKSNHTKDVLFKMEGSLINTIPLVDNFTNLEEPSTTLDNPAVLIIDGKLNGISPLKNVLTELTKDKKRTLLIVTEYISNNVKSIISDYFSHGHLISIIKSPGVSEHRQNLLKDLSVITNAKIIKEGDTVSLEDLGKLQSVVVKPKSTTIVKDSNTNTSEYFNNLIKQSEDPYLEQYDKELLEKRIDILKGKLSIIKVGGINEIQISEKYDRYEDALRAVKCALDEGIVEGGGVALFRLAVEKLTFTSKGKIEYSEPITMDEAFYSSLLTPFLQIQKNGYQIPINLQEETMFDNNVIDPLKVTKAALTNAIAVIENVLSIRSIVTDSREW